MLVLASLILLGTVTLIGLVAPDRWNWRYLIWGIGIGLLGAANQPLFLKFVVKQAGSTSLSAGEQLERAKFRTRVNGSQSVVVGTATGALSAIFDNVAFVLFGTVVLLLASLVPYLMVPGMLRRTRERQSK
jgi:hypothetical protein